MYLSVGSRDDVGSKEKGETKNREGGYITAPIRFYFSTD